MRGLRLAVDPETASRAGRAIAEQVDGIAEYLGCRRIVAYAELPGELPLACLVERARADGKTVLWPRQRPDGTLEFAPCERVEGLAAGRYGVREPPPTTPAVPAGPDVLLLVPGVAFDERGGRLGRGGGAWDRALAASRGAFAVGVGYEFQVVNAVPREAHDRPIAALLTERGARRCSGR